MAASKTPAFFRRLPSALLLCVFGISSLTLTAYAGSAYRAFSDSSYWNTPFETGAPIDPSSATYIADSENAAHTQDYLKFTLGSFAEPIYFAGASDPLYTITASGHTVKVHIPNGAAPAAGSDGQMTIYDQASGYDHVVGLHGAVFSGGQWTADGMDSYSLSSNGLEGTASGADDSSNFGHRGVSSATRAVRLTEIQAGAINHRLECFWWATAPSHYWPMVGHENNKGGIVPEGIVVRIKPSVNLDSKGLSSAAKIVATALQKYGCIVGDNSGSGNRLKLQENVDWTGILNADSLQAIPWSDWEFVKGGSVPQGTPVSEPTPPSGGGGSGSSGTGSGSSAGGSASGSSSAGSPGGTAGTDSTSTTTTSQPGDGAEQPSGSPSPATGALDSAVAEPLETIFSTGSPAQKSKALAILAGTTLLFLSIVALGAISFHRALRGLPVIKLFGGRFRPRWP